MIYGAQHGILGLALTYIPVQILEVPAALILADRVLKVSPRDVWRAAWVPIITTLIMAAIVIGTEIIFLSVLHAGDLPTLAVCLVVALVTYLGALLILDRRILVEARAVLVRGL
jgi:hypothetical protein